MTMAMKLINRVLAVVAILSGILVPIFYSPLLDNIINEKLIIKEGGEILEHLRKPPLEPTTKFYLFNLTNAEEVLRGEKPILQEVGPYVYNERWESSNITFNKNETLSFSPKKTLFFDREQSNGSESDYVITVDIPLISAVHQTTESGTYKDRLNLNDLVKRLNYTAFPAHTIRDLLWGYRDILFSIAKESMPPGVVMPDLFGLFAGRNGSADGIYTIATGRDSLAKLGLIDNWNGRSKLSFWQTEYCNTIAGSSAGSSYPPNLKKEDILRLFNPDLCRTLPLIFQEEIEHGGLSGYRFSPPKNVFDRPDQNPENECFCPINRTGSQCGTQGLFNISPCKFGAPIAISWPHFLNGDRKLIEAVEGLHPDPEKHRAYFDFLPRTSTVLQAKFRLQINAMLRQTSDFELLDGLPNMALPIIWFEMGIDQLPEEFMGKLRQAANLPGLLRSIFLGIFLSSNAILLVVNAKKIIQALQLKFYGLNGTSGSIHDRQGNEMSDRSNRVATTPEGVVNEASL